MTTLKAIQIIYILVSKYFEPNYSMSPMAKPVQYCDMPIYHLAPTGINSKEPKKENRKTNEALTI